MPKPTSPIPFDYRPFSAVQQFFKSEVAAGVCLLVAAVAAVLLANSPGQGFYHELLKQPITLTIGTGGVFGVDKPLHLWINDGLMAIFFFLVGLEIKRELLEGHLADRRQLVLPLVAAVGGMLVPAAIYAFINQGNPENLRGWAIPAATDIAFAIAIYSLVAKRLPPALKVFLLAIAILDDLGAILIIALFYNHGLALPNLAAAAVFLAGMVLLNRLNYNRASWYILLAIGMWFCVLKSGVHATIAGVLAAMTIPLHIRGDKRSLLKQLEHDLQPTVAFFIMPLFAFANAGVTLEGLTWSVLWQPVTLGVILGLFVGKQVGIFGATWLVVQSGLAHRPEGCSWRHIWGMSQIAGIGFTMSLFIATLAFSGTTHDSSHMTEVKVGILLASVLAAVAGVLTLRHAPALKLVAPRPQPAVKKPAARRRRQP